MIGLSWHFNEAIGVLSPTRFHRAITGTLCSSDTSALSATSCQDLLVYRGTHEAMLVIILLLLAGNTGTVAYTVITAMLLGSSSLCAPRVTLSVLSSSDFAFVSDLAMVFDRSNNSSRIFGSFFFAY